MSSAPEAHVNVFSAREAPEALPERCADRATRAASDLRAGACGPIVGLESVIESLDRLAGLSRDASRLLEHLSDQSLINELSACIAEFEAVIAQAGAKKGRRLRLSVRGSKVGPRKSLAKIQVAAVLQTVGDALRELEPRRSEICSSFSSASPSTAPPSLDGISDDEGFASDPEVALPGNAAAKFESPTREGQPVEIAIHSPDARDENILSDGDSTEAGKTLPQPVEESSFVIPQALEKLLSIDWTQAWTDTFGSATNDCVISWTDLQPFLSSVCGAPVPDAMLVLMRYLLDGAFGDLGSPGDIDGCKLDRLLAFIALFGPPVLATCFPRLLEIFSLNHFIGVQTQFVAESILLHRPVGTFLLRFAVGKCCHLMFSIVFGDKKFVHIPVIPDFPHGFKMMDEETDHALDFPRYADLERHYGQVLRSPLPASASSHLRAPWFAGTVSGQEAMELISGQQTGTYFMRFSSQPGCYASTFSVDGGTAKHSLIETFAAPNGVPFQIQGQPKSFETLEKLRDYYGDGLRQPHPILSSSISLFSAVGALANLGKVWESLPRPVVPSSGNLEQHYTTAPELPDEETPTRGYQNSELVTESVGETSETGSNNRMPAYGVFEAIDTAGGPARFEAEEDVSRKPAYGELIFNAEAGGTYDGDEPVFVLSPADATKYGGPFACLVGPQLAVGANISLTCDLLWCDVAPNPANPALPVCLRLRAPGHHLLIAGDGTLSADSFAAHLNSSLQSLGVQVGSPSRVGQHEMPLNAGPSDVMWQQPGAIYSGDWKDGTPDGRGSCKLPRGDEYIGHFVRGRRDGRGVCRARVPADGAATYRQYKYAGPWRDDEKEGEEGVLEWIVEDGVVLPELERMFRGTFAKGSRSGWGTSYLATGVEVFGDWRGDEVLPGFLSIFDPKTNIAMTSELREAWSPLTARSLPSLQGFGIREFNAHADAPPDSREMQFGSFLEGKLHGICVSMLPAVGLEMSTAWDGDRMVSDSSDVVFFEQTSDSSPRYSVLHQIDQDAEGQALFLPSPAVRHAITRDRAGNATPRLVLRTTSFDGRLAEFRFGNCLPVAEFREVVVENRWAVLCDRISDSIDGNGREILHGSGLSLALEHHVFSAPDHPLSKLVREISCVITCHGRNVAGKRGLAHCLEMSQSATQQVTRLICTHYKAGLIGADGQVSLATLRAVSNSCFKAFYACLRGEYLRCLRPSIDHGRLREFLQANFLVLSPTDQLRKFGVHPNLHRHPKPPGDLVGLLDSVLDKLTAFFRNADPFAKLWCLGACLELLQYTVRPEGLASDQVSRCLAVCLARLPPDVFAVLDLEIRVLCDCVPHLTLPLRLGESKLQAEGHDEDVIVVFLSSLLLVHDLAEATC